MNHRHSSYCFKTGSGGINVKLEKVSASKYISFLLEDEDRPVALLNMDGTISSGNDRFREEFGLVKTGEIKELFDEVSRGLWFDFFITAEEKEHDAFAVKVRLANDKMYSVKVRLLYCDVMEKVLAIFTVPLSIERRNEITVLNQFHKSSNLLILANRSGVIVDINNLSNKLFNLPSDYFIGKTWRGLRSVIQVEVDEFENYLNRAVTDGSVEAIRRFVQTTGEVRYYHYKTYFHEETQMFLTHVVDYTNKVKLKHKLAHKESLAQVGQMAAGIAHEIRNPLTTLKGFTQLLRGSNLEESNKYLDVIDEEIVRMESILNEMLVMSKPSQNEKVYISLIKIIADITLVISAKASIEEITIVIDDEHFPNVFIYGNVVKLKQALLNLFKNALEAMAPGGTLTIGLEVGEENQINLTVIDTGKGMTVTQLNQIFMPYFTTRSEGTGLGLPFVIKTIEEHGGTVSVSSEVGSGSKFTLSFPQVTSRIITEALVERDLTESGRLT